MVLRQVGEDRHVEVNPGHPLPIERMRADFHRNPGTIGPQHLAHQILDFNRFRRCPGRWNNALADLILHRPEQPRAETRRFHDRFDHERGRGFSIRAGYSDDFEFLRRMMVKTGRRQRQRLSRIVHPDPGCPRIEATVLFEDDGRRPAINGRLHKPVPIGLFAGHCHKHVPRLHPAGVVGNPGNIPVQRSFDGQRVHGLENLGEFHQSFATFFSSTSENCGGMERYCVTFSATPRKTGPATDPP